MSCSSFWHVFSGHLPIFKVLHIFQLNESFIQWFDLSEPTHCLIPFCLQADADWGKPDIALVHLLGSYSDYSLLESYEWCRYLGCKVEGKSQEEDIFWYLHPIHYTYIPFSWGYKFHSGFSWSKLNFPIRLLYICQDSGSITSHEEARPTDETSSCSSTWRDWKTN